MPDRRCTSCVCAPTANSTFLQQGWVPPVSPVATSACGAEGTDSSSHHNSLCSCLSASQFCSVSLVISPELLQMVHRVTSSSVSRDLPPPSLVILLYCSTRRVWVLEQRLTFSRRTGSELSLKRENNIGAFAT